MTAAGLSGAVLCGVDGSPAAAGAARLAGRIAAGLGAPVILLHVAPPPSLSGWWPGQHEDARRQVAFDRAGYLETVLAPIAIDDPVVVERIVELGSPADVLRSVADQAPAALVVVGHGGLTTLEEALLGSTSSALAQDCPCPVVLTPDVRDDAPRFPGTSFACGVDGSETAIAAAATAAGLAERFRVRLVLAHVDEAEDGGPALAAAAEAVRARAPGVAVHDERRRGPVVEELLDTAREHGAGLLAVGSRGRGPVRSALLGSVSRRLIKATDRPVLVVSPRALEPADRS